MPLYLLPNLVNADSNPACFPQVLWTLVPTLQGLIAESEKSARAFLKRFSPVEFRHVPLALLNEHTEEISPLLIPLRKGERWGLISDAGLPCLADPGANLVRLCHEQDIPLEAVIGPSAVIEALLLSGLSGQRFTFHGYFPYEKNDLKLLIDKAVQEGGTHLAIEAPYRTQKRFIELLELLPASATLSLSIDLGAPQSRTLTKTIRQWKQQPITLEKVPAVFVFSGAL